MTIVTILIFLLTYVLIASRRLRLLPIGRPAGALLGAVLMVATGAISPAETYAAVDHDTLVLLTGMMILAAYLDMAGFFERAAGGLLHIVRSPRQLLVLTALVTAGLSAFLVNDAVCLFMTPVLVATCRRTGLPLGPFLIAIATSANLGSAATLVGNPQNMIIGSLSGIPFARFLWLAAPAATVGLGVNVALLMLYYGRRLRGALPAAPARPAAAEAAPPVPLFLVGFVLCGVIVGFFGGAHLGYTALAGGTMLILAARTEPRAVFARIDWALLVFFSALFVVVAALGKTGLIAEAWALLGPHAAPTTGPGVVTFTAVMAGGSNLVSNVPMVLLAAPYVGSLADPTLGWVLLAFVTTVAGNLTLVGSVANILVAETAKDAYTLGFWEYLRFGAVSTVLVLTVGVPIILLTVGAG